MSPEQPEEPAIQRSPEEIEAEIELAGHRPAHALDFPEDVQGSGYGFTDEQDRASWVNVRDSESEVSGLHGRIDELINEQSEVDDGAIHQEIESEKGALLAALADLIAARKAREGRKP